MTAMALFSTCFMTPKTPEQREEELRSHEKRKGLVSTLPLEMKWGPHMPLRSYQGFWFTDNLLPGVMALQDQLIKTDPADIFLVSYPKSGTTWLKALAFAISDRGGANHPCSPQHPLLHLSPHECVPHIEGIFSFGPTPDLDMLRSPRIFATHIPYSSLPESVRLSGCRILYLSRDPKDSLVSLHQFSKAMRPEGTEPMPIAEALELFCMGRAGFGPVWEHLLGYWEESLRRPREVMFLSYEEMMAEPTGCVRRVAGFMGMPFSEEEEREGMVEEIVRLCSFERLSGLEVNKVGFVGEELGWNIKRSSFFRKGMVGGWKEHLSPEMAERIDNITKQKLDGSRLDQLQEANDGSGRVEEHA